MADSRDEMCVTDTRSATQAVRQPHRHQRKQHQQHSKRCCHVAHDDTADDRKACCSDIHTAPQASRSSTESLAAKNRLSYRVPSVES